MFNKVVKEFDKLSTNSNQKYIEFMRSQLGGNNCSDKILGIKVPVIRQLATKYKNIDLNIAEKFVESNVHEYKLFGLFVMCLQYKNDPNKVYNSYLSVIDHINNWDLIDYTAYKIIGANCFEAKNENIIHELSDSQNIWHKRIAILSTFYYIKNNSFKLTYNLCKKFLKCKSSCIHKASGWQLREIGKRDKELLIKFLNNYSQKMPRIMLRYAIEHLSAEERKYYINKK